MKNDDHDDEDDNGSFGHVTSTSTLTRTVWPPSCAHAASVAPRENLPEVGSQSKQDKVWQREDLWSGRNTKDGVSPLSLSLPQALSSTRWQETRFTRRHTESRLLQESRWSELGVKQGSTLWHQRSARWWGGQKATGAEELRVQTEEPRLFFCLLVPESTTCRPLPVSW